MRSSDSVTLFSGHTTGTSDAVPIQQFRSIGGTVAFATDVTAGTVIFETAPTKDYSGTWVEAFTIAFGDTAAAAPKAIGQAINVAANFARARFTVNASGGASPSAVVTLNRSVHPI